LKEDIYIAGAYKEKNPTWHIEDSPWKAGHIQKIIERNSLDPGSVCEIGCGAGEVLKQLHDRMEDSVSFTGYEISPQAFELCQERTGERLDFYLEDLLADENQDFYDILLAIDVFEHIEDYYGFLRKLNAKATYKIFHIPLDISVQTVLRAFPLQYVRDEVGHLHYYTKETALAALEDAGYKIVDYFYTATQLDLNKSFKAKLLKLPRMICFKISKDLTVRILGGYSLLVLAK